MDRAKEASDQKEPPKSMSYLYPEGMYVLALGLQVVLFDVSVEDGVMRGRTSSLRRHRCLLPSSFAPLCDTCATTPTISKGLCWSFGDARTTWLAGRACRPAPASPSTAWPNEKTD